jgi:hypothetical protein
LCHLLSKVDPLAQACDLAENPGAVANLKDRSDLFTKEVDLQREKLITCLQRGRDLVKDPLAPNFVKDDLAKLEDTWSNAQQKMLAVSEKLKSEELLCVSCCLVPQVIHRWYFFHANICTDTEKLWTDYEAKRKVLMDLLDKADAELEVCSPRHDPILVIAELQSKKFLYNELTDASTTALQGLKDTYQAMSCVSSPAMDAERPKILQQICFVETRLEKVTTLVKERVQQLENYSKKFAEFTAEIREIKNWMLDAQKILESLLLKSGPPAQREENSRELSRNVKDKLVAITDLEKRAKEFMLGMCGLFLNDLGTVSCLLYPPGPDNAVEESIEAGTVIPFSTEISGLKEVMVQLVETVELQHRVSTQELTQWEDFQSGLEVVRPWLNQIETRVVQGIPRFSTLVETQDTLDTWRVGKPALQNTWFLSHRRAVVQSLAVDSACRELVKNANKSSTRLSY